MPIKELINKIFIVITCFTEISLQNVSSFVREWMEWRSYEASHGKRQKGSTRDTTIASQVAMGKRTMGNMAVAGDWCRLVRHRMVFHSGRG